MALPISSPLDIPGNNCQLWLDAGDITTMYQTSGVGLNFATWTFPVTADSNPVGFWRDKSGYGRHFNLPAWNSTRPVYTQTGLDGLSSIYFDSRPLQSLSSVSLNSTTGQTYFIVYKPNGGQIFIYIQQPSPGNLDTYSGTGSVFPCAWKETTGTLHRIRYQNTGFDFYSGHIPNTNNATAKIMTVRTGSNVCNAYEAGLLRGSGTCSFNAPCTFTRIGGGSPTGQAYSYVGWISEVIMYDRSLNTEEQKQVEAYLGEKWRLPYTTYFTSNGNITTPSVYFNERVPTLSTACYVPNGFNIDITSNTSIGTLHGVNFDTLTNTGSFIVGTSVSGLTANGVIQRLNNTPVLRILPSSTPLTLNATSFGFRHYGDEWANSRACIIYANNRTLNFEQGGLYGYLGQSALSGEFITMNATGIQVRNSATWDRPISTTTSFSIYLQNSTVNLINCDFATGYSSYIGSGQNNYGTNPPRKMYLNNSTLVAAGTRFGGDANSVSVDIAGTSTVFLNNCTLQTEYTAHWQSAAAMRFSDNTTATLTNCNVLGASMSSPFWGQGTRSLLIGTGCTAFVNNCTIRGGDGYGTTSADSNNASYPSGIYNDGTLRLSACTVRGNSTWHGNAIYQGSGVLESLQCTFEAGNQSNAVIVGGGSARISGNMLDGPFGARAIYGNFRIEPIPPNAFLRYASDGTGAGLNAFVYQYTIDSLSAFSMPPISAVRLGVPFAGLTQVGTSVIPSPSSVSYGTLVDNTSGTAILTLELLNTLFNTPLSAITSNNTLGGRIKNSLLNVESVGHLIASFTTN